MKKSVFIVLGLFIVLNNVAFSQEEIAIIPEPVTLVKKTGVFELKDKLLVAGANKPELQPVLNYLKKADYSNRHPGHGCE